MSEPETLAEMALDHLSFPGQGRKHGLRKIQVSDSDGCQAAIERLQLQRESSRGMCRFHLPGTRGNESRESRAAPGDDDVAWHAPLIRLRKPGTETARPRMSLRMAKERSGGSARGS